MEAAKIKKLMKLVKDYGNWTAITVSRKCAAKWDSLKVREACDKADDLLNKIGALLNQ